MLARVAAELPQRRHDATISASPVGGHEYRTNIPLNSPSDDGAAKEAFLQWIWYASRREGLHLNEAADEGFSTPERVADAVRAVVAPTLRLGSDEQRELVPAAKLERYGADEVIQHSGEVPDRMTFIVSGRVRLTGGLDDGAEVPIGTLDEGGFFGQSTLTRQPVIGNARAVDEVTVVHIAREHVETLVQTKPVAAAGVRPGYRRAAGECAESADLDARLVLLSPGHASPSGLPAVTRTCGMSPARSTPATPQPSPAASAMDIGAAETIPRGHESIVICDLMKQPD